jgi:cation transport regulator ChaB
MSQLDQLDLQEFHQEMAKKCFNETWDYLEKQNRDANDEQQMLHLAHAARYHQSFVGNDRNFAISDWQISRVYAALKQPRLALSFAKSSLERMESANLSDILCTGYEAMARACAVAREFGAASDYLQRAREQLAESNLDEQDRKIYLDQIQETEQLIVQ